MVRGGVGGRWGREREKRKGEGKREEGRKREGCREKDK